ncbi:deoxyribodipyrimidine photo-lyase isoform X1 [Octopus bimaculoides]|nr:deoxyribodipyrimidine photo-lyase isoform X1 [Octopus bimaculoides]
MAKRTANSKIEDEPADLKKSKNESLSEKIQESRIKCAKSVQDFKFNKKRVRLLNEVEEFLEGSQGVLYWMVRDQRVQDNWAMLFAQRLALKEKTSLHVCFCVVVPFLEATKRHYDFLLNGLKEVEKECCNLDIQFHLLKGDPSSEVSSLVKELNIGAVVTDFSPLRLPRKWLTDLTENLPKNVGLCQVDTHNIVPCWITSEKQEYGARTIRNKIHSQMCNFLTEFPPVIKHPHKAKTEAKPTNWNTIIGKSDIDETVKPVDWAKPGTVAGYATLESFCNERLKHFATERNDPTKNSLSNLSPWLRFGHISPQRCILVVKKFQKSYKNSVDAFVEEAVIRSELADNYCYYQKDYDNINGAYEWARNSLKQHAKDKREYVYSRKVFEEGKTHDQLWNAAQIQLVKEGKMHGFLRMYWAKKILEWSTTPSEALEIAIYLNDRYSLDGIDSNGYVGCMWSVCAIHDRAWGERKIIGKIRIMTYEGCKRKFDVDAYITKYCSKNSKKI